MSDYNEITAIITTEEPAVAAIITTEEPAVAATLDDLRYLVFEGMKGEPGEPGAPARLVGELRADGTLYVSNLYSYEDLEEATF